MKATTLSVFKLFRVKKNGDITSLFINKTVALPVGKWIKAEPHPTKGFAFRPAWHSTEKQVAPHLSMRGRAWFEVEIKGYQELVRPEIQGGKWYLSKWIRITKKVS
jgi:hypothetical protein